MIRALRFISSPPLTWKVLFPWLNLEICLDYNPPAPTSSFFFCHGSHNSRLFGSNVFVGLNEHLVTAPECQMLHALREAEGTWLSLWEPPTCGKGAALSPSRACTAGVCSALRPSSHWLEVEHGLILSSWTCDMAAGPEPLSPAPSTPHCFSGRGQ